MPQDSAAISVPPLQCATPSPLLCRQAGDEKTSNHLMTDVETSTKAGLKIGDANASASKPEAAYEGATSKADFSLQGLKGYSSINNNNKKKLIRPALSVANFSYVGVQPGVVQSISQISHLDINPTLNKDFNIEDNEATTLEDKKLVVKNQDCEIKNLPNDTKKIDFMEEPLKLAETNSAVS